MPAPLFSVRIYENERLIRTYNDLKPETVYFKLEGVSNTWILMSRDEIYTRMATLLIDESFRCAYTAEKYALITKMGYDDEEIIKIPIAPYDGAPKDGSVVQRGVKFKLPASPELVDNEDKTNGYRVFCVRHLELFLCWLKQYIIADPVLPLTR
jgi:hypothetical protein